MLRIGMPSARTKRINDKLGDLYLHGWQITGPHTPASYEGDATMSESLAVTAIEAELLRAELVDLERAQRKLREEEETLHQEYMRAQCGSEEMRLLALKLEEADNSLDRNALVRRCLERRIEDLESPLALDDVWHSRNYSERY